MEEIRFNSLNHFCRRHCSALAQGIHYCFEEKANGSKKENIRTTIKTRKHLTEETRINIHSCKRMSQPPARFTGKIRLWHTQKGENLCGYRSIKKWSGMPHPSYIVCFMAFLDACCEKIAVFISTKV